ncbi:MAG: hypothetical protein AAB492_05810 [Patescibacteria group bacterium]
MTRRRAQGRLSIIHKLLKDTAFAEWSKTKFGAEEGARVERGIYGSSPHASIFFDVVRMGLNVVRLRFGATREEMRAAEKLKRLDREGEKSKREQGK